MYVKTCAYDLHFETIWCGLEIFLQNHGHDWVMHFVSRDAEFWILNLECQISPLCHDMWSILLSNSKHVSCTKVTHLVFSRKKAGSIFIIAAFYQKNWYIKKWKKTMCYTLCNHCHRLLLLIYSTTLMDTA